MLYISTPLKLMKGKRAKASYSIIDNFFEYMDRPEKTMRYTFLMLLIPVLMISLAANAQPETFFDKVDNFLKTCVKDGRVDYKALKKNPAQLENLVQTIATFDSSVLAEGNTQKAFWINVYNILVINGIVIEFPTDSPLNIEGFFKTIPRLAAGKELTLDDIENKYIREVYHDARIHFALVCAAKGCPPIISDSYRPDILDAQLDRRTKAILNDPDFIQINYEEKEVLISEIFNWFKADFEQDGKTILEYINQFREKSIPTNFAIGYYSYDWDLNTL